jgi:uncharacterized repeat protein (TIGR01451 family)
VSTTPAPEDEETPTTPPSPTATDSEAPLANSGDSLGAQRAAAEAPAAEGPVVKALIEGPGLTLVKTADVRGTDSLTVSRVGQVIEYSFVATNNGTVAINQVEITDELEGLSPLSCTLPSPVTLQPTEVLRCSATLTITQAALDFGSIFNFASVFGEAATGDPENPVDDVGAVDDAAVQVDQSPSIALKATVSPTGTADRGDRLRYLATATNTGNVTLTGARITSSLDSLDLDCEPSARATLTPGASISCAGSYRVTTADARRGRVTNELTARAEPPYGATDSRSDDVTDDVRLRVAVTKIADDSDPGLADTGGPALPIGLAGLVAVATGLGLIRRTRRI